MLHGKWYDGTTPATGEQFEDVDEHTDEAWQQSRYGLRHIVDPNANFFERDKHSEEPEQAGEYRLLVPFLVVVLSSCKAEAAGVARLMRGFVRNTLPNVCGRNAHIIVAMGCAADGTMLCCAVHELAGHADED